ncbi:pyridoxamine 5'-phosphate oxidase family protein [Cyclobacterium amurskyense]|uniref:Pyridoxamine 5'-phosphate oxidase-related FMN-binding protein n=1 Tax=Cyclobacterium amurskyense TaxID=320787 RepID=A0A0H4PG03_9BACT|nr:pyridoxamine 5'-phosphate oxidase family protein [Cyclobacterium amurskyense]AKP53416.1 Pyridoxamine 5'-phosphate oxidase-related FMN-binding protein [Cyclobacterium amurskyense]|tara:strand:- start:1260 stop:1892 length:633 start_codon:yes stop_codon:yes gene_type:complete
MKVEFKNQINTLEELREILGFPRELVQKKSINFIDGHCKNFIAKSPMLFLSTANKDGSCDVSPRGDPAGFVDVLNEQYLVLPERPGNKRCDSMVNILSNPHIGLIFIIPGLKETLRINGKAILSRDKDLLEKYQINGKCPEVGIIVEVEECYIHCAKAFLRSKLWEPETWLEKEQLPVVAKVLADHINSENFSSEEIASVLSESYLKRLY